LTQIANRSPTSQEQHMPSTPCPKCYGNMEIGVIPDIGQSNYTIASSWLEGEPEKSFWSGMKTKDKRRFAIVSYRCTKCGFLENYATQPATGV
jgi:RNase P subunit RPR2